VPRLARQGADRSATRLDAEGRPPGSTNIRTFINSVGPRYFATLGIPFVAGRDFDRRDRQGAPPVAIVNEAFARACFPQQSALGQRVRRSERDPYSQIVGIVRDSKYGSIAEESTPIFYAAYTQYSQISSQIRPVIIHVRTAAAPASFVPELRRVIADVEPTTFAHVRTLRDATSGEAELRGFGGNASLQSHPFAAEGNDVCPSRTRTPSPDACHRNV